MKYDPDIHHRRTIRLKDYDYSAAGAYFVTICTHERHCLFGEITGGVMVLNDLGRIVAEEWQRSGELRAEIEPGDYVVMPNHFHGIVMINDIHRRGDRRSPNSVPHFDRRSPCGNAGNQDIPPNYGRPPVVANHGRPPVVANHGRPPVAPTGPKSGSIGALVAGFKSAVTRRINIMRHNPGASVWQRNYYEHVIRDEDDYRRITEYVADNPRRWLEDRLHPDNFPTIR